MSRISNPLKSDHDDRLADFTDGVLDGQVQTNASNADEELLLLEETVLHLKTVYPTIVLDEIRVKQMHARLKNRIKRDAQEAEQPFWKKWKSLLQMGGMLAGVLAMVLIFIFVSPFFATAGSFTTATALSPIKGTFMVLGLSVFVLLLLFWMRRRK